MPQFLVLSVESHTLEVREEGWRKEDFPLDIEAWVRDWLGRLTSHKLLYTEGSRALE